MKKSLLIFTLLFSILMFSSTSFAEWTKVTTNTIGDTFYVDFERIRKHDGYVYWWDLTDYLKPTIGILSWKAYLQGDCKLFGYKYLSTSYHKEPMGRGRGVLDDDTFRDWVYSAPNSIGRIILKKVCEYLN